jgi:phospholipid/cholesterol/gamma-HCH transport system substrate-binding protein
MPDRSKVRWSQLKVGITAGGAFVVLFALIFLLTTQKGLLQKNILLLTYMDDAHSLAEGTPVRLNGITVGYVTAFKLTSSRDPRRTVEFDMQVQRRFMPDIPVDSIASIAASNLLGDKFININKGTSPNHVKPGDELQSVKAQDIPELFAQSTTLLLSLQSIIGRLDNLLVGVEKGNGNLGKFVKDEELYNRLNAIAAEGQQLMVDARTGGGTISKLIYDPTLYNEIQSPIKRIDSMLADLQAGQGTAGKLLKDPALYNDARETIAQLHALMNDLNAGKGTAGKLLKDEQLHQRFTELTAKLNTTLDKINSGQGTLGQLAVNPALYESLNGATREVQALMSDFRKNPKKFLSIRLTLF